MPMVAKKLLPKYYSSINIVLKQSKGIVLSYVKYSESSIIAKIYTKDFGLQSYMAKGVRSSKSKSKIALFEPLAQVEIITYHNENKTIHTLKEIRSHYSYQSIPFDEIKRSILFFLDEILINTIKEESSNESLFDWLAHSLTWFDLSEESALNFHLAFMIQLSRFLGFYPKKSSQANNRFFDLENGVFVNFIPKTANYLNEELTFHFNKLYENTFEEAAKLALTSPQRRELINALVNYYKIHFPGFKDLKSLDVLKAILS